LVVIQTEGNHQIYTTTASTDFHASNSEEESIEMTKEVLNQAVSALIKLQEPNPKEIMKTNCHKLKYEVYVKLNNFNYVKLFRCIEEQDFCMNNFCHGDCRSFGMKFNLVCGIKEYSETSNIVFWAKRDFKCVFCCLDRPELKLYWGANINNTLRPLGIIKEPYLFSKNKFQLCSSAQKIHLIVEGESSQCGFLFRGTPCGKCSEIVLPIYMGYKEKSFYDGLIVRKQSYCEKNFLNKGDNYEILFPLSTTIEDKIMLITLGLMLDSRYFNEE